MPRSAGVTASAVIVLIGSGFTVLGGVMVLLASTFIVKSSFGANAPVNLVYVLVIEAAVVLVFGGWGLAAGTGLIYLQRWARISMLV
ncbi:MAG TPA: hypothetical protein VFF42_00455 [Candidatus Eremiobacteraceae bacterium]|nr:hypothetical protein [Candidatus Eremiobacteraceae bacterium]